ncbi:MAG: Gfo/Idh/MocA family oxidoreductase [Mycobacteriales bacterium]
MNVAGEQLRVAVVGTRGHAQRVALPTIAASRRAVLVGVLGGDPERTRDVAAGLGVAAYPSLEALAQAGDVDAVWLTAPNHLHASMATQLLDSGVAVLLEKPLATDLAEAAALVEAAASGPTLRVAYQHRFRAAHRLLREQVRDGVFGSVGQLRVHRYWRFPYFGEEPGTQPAAWRSSPATSGGWSINDIGSHLVDLVLWLCDRRPVTVLDAVFTRQFPGVDNDSSAFLTLRMGSACYASVECSNVLTSPGSLIELYSQTGWARLTGSFEPTASLVTSHAPELRTTSEDAYLQMFDDFVGACAGEPSLGATAAEALVSVEVVDAARARGRYLEDLG